MKHDSSTMLLEPPSVPETWEPLDAVEASIPRQAPAPAWLDRGQIPGLDGLRAVAILLVLMVRSVQTAGFPEWPLLREAAHHGYIGVDLFFVVSGFLITTLLAREWERHGGVNLKRFYLRRFLRIMPAYCGLLITIAICQGLGKFQIAAGDWIGALTYTTNFLNHPSSELGHTWSLSIEEHFYLLWPFVLFFGGVAGGWRVAIGCIVGCWLARCGIAVGLPRLVSATEVSYYASMAELWTFTRLDTISMGCLLALACRSASGRVWLDRLCRPPLLCIYFLVLCTSLKLDTSTKYHLCVAYSLNAACLALLMWGLIRSEGLARRILSNRVLTTIGLGSYSIYLWHRFFIDPRQTAWMHLFPQNVFLVLAAALVSYWLIERPFNRLKDRVAA